MKAQSLKEVLAISLLMVSLGVLGFVLLDEVGLTGHVAASVNLILPVPAPCNITIQPGWNSFSLFCWSTSDDVDTFYAEHFNDTRFDLIYTYQSSDVSDPWKVRNEDLPNWVIDDLASFDRRQGYWGYWPGNNESFFIANASKRIPTTINLYQGWNFAGYASNDSIFIEDGIGTFNVSYDKIIWYNYSDGSYVSYEHGGNLSFIEPYQAYWIYMNSSDAWVVSW